MTSRLSLYQVDAFADSLFTGNPAAVCPLEFWLPDEVLQAIAEENNLSETAFVVREKFNIYHLRWFTPVAEVALCGHATLATAHVMFTSLGYEFPEIQFETRSGALTVYRERDGYVMDFPGDAIARMEMPGIASMLGCRVVSLWRGTSDILVEVESQEVVQQLRPDFRSLAAIAARGVIVTAPGTETDIVSRCFYPAYGIDEDPVTGSAHTTLFPFWAERLGKNRLSAVQLSARRGHIFGEVKGDRVWLRGKAVTYLEGTISIND